MQFYLAYGAMLMLAPRRTTVTVLLTLLAVAPAYRLALAAFVPWSSEAIGWLIHAGPMTQADAFAAGGILGFMMHYRMLTRRLALLLLRYGLLAFLAFTLVFVLLRPLPVYDLIRALAQYTAITALFAGAVALAATDEPWLRWLTGHRLLQRIGVISYGAYILHVLPLAFGPGDLSPPLKFAVVWPLTLVLAEISFRTIENRSWRIAMAGFSGAARLRGWT
jgi:peptidoglycan/LPS O-acetylase OafA/YrhL